MNDNTKVLANIAVAQLNKMDDTDPKKLVKDTAIRMEFQNNRRVLEDAASKGFQGADGDKPRVKTTLMTTPNSIRCHNSFWQSAIPGKQPVSDPRSLPKNPSHAVFPEETNTLDWKSDGERQYVY